MNNKDIRVECYSQLYEAMQIGAKNEKPNNIQNIGLIIETEADILSQFGLPCTFQTLYYSPK